MTNYQNILRYAWRAYDHTREIRSIEDISALVSTNHVFKLIMEDGNVLIAKVTYFGSFEGFAEDHTIINVLANNLPVRYANFLSRGLMKGNQLFFHRHIDDEQDAWIIFYRPIQIQEARRGGLRLIHRPLERLLAARQQHDLVAQPQVRSQRVGKYDDWAIGRAVFAHVERNVTDRDFHQEGSPT